MIELIFSDSAAGTLRQAKELRPGTMVHRTEMLLQPDGEYRPRPYEIPYTGPLIGGSADEVLAINLYADRGDISNLFNLRPRLEAYREMCRNFGHPLDEEWLVTVENQLRDRIARLTEAALEGEKIRIWASDTPGNQCMLCWCMNLLRRAKCEISLVTAPKILPNEQGFSRYSQIGSFPVEAFPRLLEHEHRLTETERFSLYAQWRELAWENAPLRALVNGQLCSVPESFYDYVLDWTVPDRPVHVATVIAQAIAKGPDGTGDHWYAARLWEKINRGEVVVEEKGEHFHRWWVRRTNPSPALIGWMPPERQESSTLWYGWDYVEE